MPKIENLEEMKAAAEIADALNISYEQLCREAILYQGYKEWEIEDKPEPSYDEIWKYVWNETNNGYADKLCEARDEYLESFRPDYVKKADEILEEISAKSELDKKTKTRDIKER